MDEIHKEFYAIALRLVTCEEASALTAMRAFQHHALEHFAEEDGWMTATDFPPRDCHMEEHAAVLSTVRELCDALEQGTCAADTIRDFGMYLFEWFPGHADYLDSALAAWMCKRNFGGKPVVLKRRRN